MDQAENQQITQSDPSTPNPAESKPQSNNKSFYVILFVLLLLALGVIAFIMSGNRTNTAIPQNNVSVPTQVPSPTLSVEEKEVEAVDIEDTAPTGLAEVEKDLQAL